MKITQENPGFRPITIKLENENEAKILAAVLGKVSGNGVDGNMIYQMYRKLTENVDYSKDYVAVADMVAKCIRIEGI